MLDTGVVLDDCGRVAAAGDMVLSSDLVVTAIDQGRKTEICILDYVSL